MVLCGVCIFMFTLTVFSTWSRARIGAPVAVAAAGHHGILRLGRVRRHGGRDAPQRPLLPDRDHQADDRRAAQRDRDRQPRDRAGRVGAADLVRLEERDPRPRQLPDAVAASARPSTRRSFPIAGVLIVLFTIEQLVNGWKHGFEGPEDRDDIPCVARTCRMSAGADPDPDGRLFLGFGYMGVPVSFALMAGVLVATAFTPVSLQSMVGQLFHGIDSETLLAVPFFLLVGELMASSDVVHRMIRLSQTLVGHLRGGLAQVVTLFSMFFAGISGSSVADVAVLSRTVAPRDGQGGLRPRLHRRADRLGVDDGQPDPAVASWRWSTAPPATSRSAACSWPASCPAC